MRKISIRKMFEYITLKNKILVYLFVFTMIPSIIGATYFYITVSRTNLKDKFYVIESNLKKCAYLINRDYSDYLNRGTSIMGNSFINSNINRDFSKNIEGLLIFKQNMALIFGEYESYESSFENPFKILTGNQLLYCSNYVGSNKNVIDNEKIKELYQLPINVKRWQIEEKQGNKDSTVITYYRKLNSNRNSDALLKCSIPFDNIKYYMESIAKPEQGIVIYYDEEHKMHDYSASTGIDEKEIKNLDESAYYIFNEKLINHHEISVLIPKYIFKLHNLKVFFTILIILIGFLLILLCVSLFTSNSITKDLDQFIDIIQGDEKLLLNDALIHIDRNNEIGYIQKRFKEAIKQINDLHHESLQYNKHINALELELLQSKINPHLLYNSLSEVKWSAISNEDYKTAGLIDTLTKYYRLALNKGNNVLQVRQEVEMIKEYVRINEFSRATTYQLTIDIEEKVMESYIIKHLLQPIVENAILHGFDSYNQGEKKIVIKGWVEEENIILKIIDNGMGMDEAKLQSLTDFNYVSSYGGYGVKNLTNRIYAYYGEDYGITITSEKGNGTIVTVTVAHVSKEELSNRLTRQ